ncbi:hypothetical protein BDZ45DRAFT_718947 [Acephala macrosclerotiorum]|nr:hypothetical protein BDZ45DRAFT_718947 [Acephala macrosclerotiorum]
MFRYALTPLTVALSTRESILSLLTGIPYQNFNILYRWLGGIIYAPLVLHTLGWILIEGYFYQPQPASKCMIRGCVALLFVSFLSISSPERVVKLTEYEFFRKTHYVIAELSRMLDDRFSRNRGLDRVARLLRTLLIHTGYIDARKDQNGGVVRLDFDYNHEPWAIGQHFFLTFLAQDVDRTTWQSHPFTTASVHALSGRPNHTYIIRCRKGETRRLKSLALDSQYLASTPVVLCGPYGKALLPNHETANILAIAGGTGISFTLPLVLAAASTSSLPGAAIDFVWIIHRLLNMEWITIEPEQLKKRAERESFDLRVHIFITQDTAQQDTSSPDLPSTGEKSLTDLDIAPVCTDRSSGSTPLKHEKSDESCRVCFERPSPKEIVNNFLKDRAVSPYRARVIASGPASMGHDLRAAVAAVNDGEKVWRGDNRGDVSLNWDDRMG